MILSCVWNVLLFLKFSNSSVYFVFHVQPPTACYTIIIYPCMRIVNNIIVLKSSYFIRRKFLVFKAFCINIFLHIYYLFFIAVWTPRFSCLVAAFYFSYSNINVCAVCFHEFFAIYFSFCISKSLNLLQYVNSAYLAIADAL